MTSSPRKCPICGKPRVADHAPFCSPRCRDRDLMQWFGEGYAIPGRPALPGEEGEPQADADDS
ncbi:MAG: DNA gyrase inhibitor YacG [Sphingomonadales bacterium]|nr:DNA gyrase inhibitor YacG [Sphingomonadales bacterium]